MSRAVPCLVGVAVFLAAGCSQSSSGVAASPAATPAPAAAADPPAAIQGRKGELTNPDNSTVVFLYHDLAGLAPPLDRWVEDDSRVRLARPIDKAEMRKTVRAELESAGRAVQDIGFIRLSLGADLSDYDPSYGEFTVGALAPSSVVSFDALGEKVSLRFGNGRTAQIWRVSPQEAEQVRDRIGQFGSVTIDVLLRITAVQPGVSGGTLVTDVVDYELRDSRTRSLIGRVHVS